MQEAAKQTQSLNEQAWLYYMAHQAELFRMCKRAANNDVNRAEEYMSDVVLERLPRIIELWDRTRPLQPYVNVNIRLYLFKETVKAYRESNKLQSYDKLADIEGFCVADDTDFIGEDEVQNLLEVLTPFEKEIVTLYYVDGCSYREIGEMGDMSRIEVSSYVRRAIDKVRESLSSGELWE